MSGSLEIHNEEISNFKKMHKQAPIHAPIFDEIIDMTDTNIDIELVMTAALLYNCITKQQSYRHLQSSVTIFQSVQVCSILSC